MSGSRVRPRGNPIGEVACFNFNILIDGPPTVEIALYMVPFVASLVFSKTAFKRDWDGRAILQRDEERKKNTLVDINGSAREGKFEFLEEKHHASFIIKRKYEVGERGKGKKKSIVDDTSDASFRSY